MKPILFNTEMVRVILEGRKTVTQWIVSERTLDKYYDYDEWCNAVMPHDIPCTRSYEKDFFMEKQPYRPGDILYIPQAWKCVGIFGEIGYEAEFRDGQRERNGDVTGTSGTLRRGLGVRGQRHQRGDEKRNRLCPQIWKNHSIQINGTGRRGNVRGGPLCPMEINFVRKYSKSAVLMKKVFFN